MPNLTDAFYKLTKNVKTGQYIETGTYLGNGIKDVLNNYDTVHSIELSAHWFDHNVEQFKNNKNVQMHLGDSKEVLPVLLDSIYEPVTIFLDAHYSGKPTAFGQEETPLLHELAMLQQRGFDDIIIIDDCRLLGKTGSCGISDNHPVYPTMTYDWSGVTETEIKKRMKPGYVLLKNDKKIFSDGQYDQYILVKVSAPI